MAVIWSGTNALQHTCGFLDQIPHAWGQAGPAITWRHTETQC